MIIPAEHRIWFDVVSANRPAEILVDLVRVARVLARNNPLSLIFVSYCSDYEYKHLFALFGHGFVCEVIYSYTRDDTAKPGDFSVIYEKGQACTIDSILEHVK